jgi:hypothetical protein
MQKITKEQAIKIVEQALSSLKLTLAEHAHLQNCLKVIIASSPEKSEGEK